MRSKGMVFIYTVWGLLIFTGSLQAKETGYFTQMGRTLVTGVKNIVTSPWEIPYTIGQYDKKDDGNPRFLRDAAGLADGTFRTLTRLGCGAWDVVFSVVPGDQEGLPLKPETFF